MTGRPVSPTDALVADYVRSAMRVDLPQTLTDDVIRSVADVPQARRAWFSGFALLPAVAAVAATALIIAVGMFLLAPRPVGPPSEPTPTPARTLTPENARVLTEPGDVIRIPALDGGGQFGTITIERGDEKAGYEGFVPFAVEDVFFIQLFVKYEPERSTSEQYGEWEFAFAVDLGRNGFDHDDRLERGVGFLGMDGQPGFESAPQPLLQGKRFGDEVLEGWLVLELPAAASDFDLYLVYGHGEWTNGIENMLADASALFRRPGEPVGVTVFDPNYVPPGQGSPMPLPSFYGLPTPMPSPAATFEPTADAEADALFEAIQSCTNSDLGLTVTFPASWYANEAFEDVTACTIFGPEPIDSVFLLRQLGDSLIVITKLDAWTGGIEQPQVERLPVAGRLAWHISWTEDQLSYGTVYLVPLTEDPYGPFVSAGAGKKEGTSAILERMLIRLQFSE